MFLNPFSRKPKRPKAEPDEYLPSDTQQASRDAISRRRSEVTRNVDALDDMLRRPGLSEKSRADLETSLMRQREELLWLQEAADTAPFTTVDPRAEFMERSVRDLRAQAKEQDIPRAEVMTKGQLAEAMVNRRSEATGKRKEGTSRPAEKGGKMSIFSSTSRRIYGLVGGDARTRVFRLTALALAVAVLFPPVQEDEIAIRYNTQLGQWDFSSEPSHIGFRPIFLVATRNTFNPDLGESGKILQAYLESRVFVGRLRIDIRLLAIEVFVILTMGLLLAYSFPSAGENRQ